MIDDVMVYLRVKSSGLRGEGVSGSNGCGSSVTDCVPSPSVACGNCCVTGNFTANCILASLRIGGLWMARVPSLVP